MQHDEQNVILCLVLWQHWHCHFVFPMRLCLFCFSWLNKTDCFKGGGGGGSESPCRARSVAWDWKHNRHCIACWNLASSPVLFFALLFAKVWKGITTSIGQSRVGPRNVYGLQFESLVVIVNYPPNLPIYSIIPFWLHYTSTTWVIGNYKYRV